MNILEITPEKVQLTLLLNELNIFKSSLTEVLDTLPQYRIIFLLFSLKNSKTYSGIKAVIFNINDNKHILFKTVIQQISVNTLSEIISYFDEYIYLTKKEDVFDKYVLSALNYNNYHILDIQALSGNIISEKEGTLNIHLSLNISDEENTNKYFDVQAPVSFDMIHEFTSAIKEYLIDSVHNDAK